MSAVARLHHRPVTSDEPHCGRLRRSISGSKAGRGNGAPKLGTYRPTRTGATTPVRGGRQRDSRALRLPRSSPVLCRVTVILTPAWTKRTDDAESNVGR